MSTPEYRVDFRVRNNWLLARMEEKGLYTGTDLACAANISVDAACRFLRLASPPISKNGRLIPSAEKVCRALDAAPGELWPPDHLDAPLPRSHATVELSKHDVAALLEAEHAPSPEQFLIESQLFGRALEAVKDRLTEREWFVLRHRFGLEGCEPETLEQVGKRMGAMRERVRQIEAKGLRRAYGALANRHPHLVRGLGFQLPKKSEAAIPTP